MNDGNLIDMRNRTPEERREMARLGGIASGKARRRKKMMRELLEMFLDEEIEGEQFTRKEKAALNMAKLISEGSATDTDFIKAFVVVRDTLGESPVKKIGRLTVNTEYEDGDNPVNEMFGIENE